MDLLFLLIKSIPSKPLKCPQAYTRKPLDYTWGFNMIKNLNEKNNGIHRPNEETSLFIEFINDPKCIGLSTLMASTLGTTREEAPLNYFQG